MDLKVLAVAGTIFAFLSARYLIIAGSAFAYFWVWKKERWQYRRIQQRFPDKKHIYDEIKYSLGTFVVFTMTGVGIYFARKSGLTRIYENVSDYGLPYFFFSIVLAILIHDTYFYWAHRFMHLKWIFPYVHRVHHLSNNPSPWASFSFHPLEAVAEAAIMPLIVFLIPVHKYAVLSFLMYMTLMNVLGHIGYELFPAGFTRHWLFRWHNTSTHHNMHHSRVNCNYGLYFNWWDRIMGTNHEKYHETFDEVKARPRPAAQTHERTAPGLAG